MTARDAARLAAQVAANAVTLAVATERAEAERAAAERAVAEASGAMLAAAASAALVAAAKADAEEAAAVLQQWVTEAAGEGDGHGAEDDEVASATLQSGAAATAAEIAALAALAELALTTRQLDTSPSADRRDAAKKRQREHEAGAMRAAAEEEVQMF